jgi:hypothetical protein
MAYGRWLVVLMVYGADGAWLWGAISHQPSAKSHQPPANQ